MPRMAKKSGAYHHGDLRRVLLDAAIRVVEKEGTAGLSLHALAKKAGVSSGAPYHHFETREDLLIAIAGEGFELLTASLKEGAAEEVAGQRAGETATEAHLRGLGRGYVRFALAHPGHFRLMFRPEMKQALSERERARGAGAGVSAGTGASPADVLDDSFVMVVSGLARWLEERGHAEPMSKTGEMSAELRRLVLVTWSAVHGACVLWLDGPLAAEGLVANEAELGPTVADTIIRLLRQSKL